MQLLSRTLIVAVSLSAGIACAQEKRLHRSALPASVAATIDREAKGTTIKGYSTEREHGKKVYEAKTVVRGHTRDLQISEDGTLNEVEEEVAFDQLPASVQAGLKARAKGATITKVESLTRQGKLVSFEASISKGSSKGEVHVGPNGEILAHDE